MDDKSALFKALIGKNADPYPFQLRVADRLSAGGSVLLSAPTGAGKTWAALLGFLNGLSTGDPHADKTLYALPLRSLATGLHRSTDEACRHVADWGALGRLPEVTIQTGEQKDDPFFTGEVVFTTIDQLLAGYLQIPLALPVRLANINAGALVGSLVVLDEVHLLDPARSLATVMEMGRRMCGLSQFLLMTATLSRPAREALAEYFGAVLEGPTPEELMAMPAQAEKERRYHWRPESLTAQAVMECHGGKRSIVICNTVKRSQEIYTTLEKIRPDDTRLFLLHSRFLPEDRKTNEELLAAYFGPNPEHTNAVLIATQVVEAGIDISADNLHTELCPANSLVQRAGRCARFPDRNKGDVHIYELPQAGNGGLLYLPYEKEEADLTREVMQSYDGRILCFIDEQNLVDSVHARREVEIIKGNRRRVQSTLRERVIQAMMRNDRSAVEELIRDVDSVGIMVADNPETVDLLGGLEAISIPRSTLYGHRDMLLSDGEALAWVPLARNEGDEDDGRTGWRPIRDLTDIKTAWLMVLSPRIAGYCKTTGLTIGEPGTATGIKYKAKPLRPSFGYECETYQEHIRRCLRALSEFRLGAACGRAASVYGWRKEEIARLIELVVGLHDLGKLSQRWQKAIQAWQYDVYPAEGEKARGNPLGHSTYRPDNGDASKSNAPRYNRGTHAGEGAGAAFLLLAALGRNMFPDEDDRRGVLSAALTAIARHHSPRVDTIEEYQLIPNTEKVVRESLCEIVDRVEISLEAHPDRGRRHAVSGLFMGQSDEFSAWLPLYWCFVRHVRLADQEAVKRMVEETKGGEKA